MDGGVGGPGVAGYKPLITDSSSWPRLAAYKLFMIALAGRLGLIHSNHGSAGGPGTLSNPPSCLAGT